jgi:hypothetical protein
MKVKRHSDMVVVFVVTDMFSAWETWYPSLSTLSQHAIPCGSSSTPKRCNWQVVVNCNSSFCNLCFVVKAEDGTDDEEDILANDYIEQEESFFADLFDPANASAKKV